MSRPRIPTTDVNTILDAIIVVLKGNEKLANVHNWYKINGIIPGKKPTISAGCDDEDYEPYTREVDQGTAKIKIYVSLDNRDLASSERRKEEERVEYGERCIRQMAKDIRLCLANNYSLNGVIETSFSKKIEYVTADGQVDLHVAVISFDVDFYASRMEDVEEPTVATIDMKMELEGS